MILDYCPMLIFIVVLFATFGMNDLTGTCGGHAGVILFHVTRALLGLGVRSLLKSWFLDFIFLNPKP